LGAWQYGTQFWIAVAGAICLIAFGVSFAVGWRRLTLLMGIATAAAAAGWIAFAITGAI
jgi:biotin transporter BioY